MNLYMHTNTSHRRETDTFCIGTFFVYFFLAHTLVLHRLFSVLSFKSGKYVGFSENKSYQNKEKTTHLYSRTRRHGSYMPFTMNDWVKKSSCLFCRLRRWNKGKHNKFNGCQCAGAFQYFQLDTPWIFCGDFSPHAHTHTLSMHGKLKMEADIVEDLRISDALCRYRANGEGLTFTVALRIWTEIHSFSSTALRIPFNDKENFKLYLILWAMVFNILISIR